MGDHRAKVLVVGPARCGKSRIGNHLSEYDESPDYEKYNPTAGAAGPPVARPASPRLHTSHRMPDAMPQRVGWQAFESSSLSAR